MSWSDPPTNSGIMDFNCNFPAKIAQQPRDQNHKQFERPNLLNPIFLMLNRSMKSLWGQPTWNQIKSTLDRLVNPPDLFGSIGLTAGIPDQPDWSHWETP
jgi:hypothetical protein